MLTKRLDNIHNDDFSFHYSSFTQKSKQRLELFRRRLLQQINDDSRCCN